MKNVLLILITLYAASSASCAFSQSNPVYIQFSPAAVKGALYQPDAPQPPAHVAILVIHRTSNVMGSLACTELAKRGFKVLCMNPRSDNNEALEVGNHRSRREIGSELFEETAGDYESSAVGWQWRRTNHELLSSRGGKRAILLPGAE